jgi:hypothetical protein
MTWLDRQILETLRDQLLSLSPYIQALLLPAGWCVLWLWGVNWHRLWPALAKGAWAPAVLLALVAAFVWTKLVPGSWTWPGFVTIPGGWWQLGSVALLMAAALFCGWLQGYLGWSPQEISLEPPAPEQHHHHH